MVAVHWEWNITCRSLCSRRSVWMVLGWAHMVAAQWIWRAVSCSPWISIVWTEADLLRVCGRCAMVTNCCKPMNAFSSASEDVFLWRIYGSCAVAVLMIGISLCYSVDCMQVSVFRRRDSCTVRTRCLQSHASFSMGLQNN
jgi:hypothetical protein